MTEDETEVTSQMSAKESLGIPLDTTVRFPEVPTDENPEDGDALRLIVTGQEGQRNLYDVLAKSLKKEKAFLVRMLRRDWERRFPALIHEGRQLLARSRGIAEKELGELDACPPLEEIGEISRAIEKCTSRELLQVLGRFGRRCFVCGRLLPWKAEAARVFKFFAECVEAEDHHVELLAQLSALVD